MQQTGLSHIPAGLESTSESVVSSMPLASESLSHGISFGDLFWGADPVIKLVMLGLIAASFWCWTIIFHKSMQLKRLNRLADQFDEVFWSGGALDDLYDRLKRPSDPLSATFCAAMQEWKRSLSKGVSQFSDARDMIQQRIERAMFLTINREISILERHLGFLASTGSAAPFVGLLGTVLGIMNSFQSIAVQQNTNLAVVAPGIAEALFATAIGLVAAIPAVIAYNKLSSDIQRYGHRLTDFASEFMGIVGRQFEEGAA